MSKPGTKSRWGMGTKQSFSCKNFVNARKAFRLVTILNLWAADAKPIAQTFMKQSSRPARIFRDTHDIDKRFSDKIPCCLHAGGCGLSQSVDVPVVASMQPIFNTKSRTSPGKLQDTPHSSFSLKQQTPMKRAFLCRKTLH